MKLLHQRGHNGFFAALLQPIVSGPEMPLDLGGQKLYLDGPALDLGQLVEVLAQVAAAELHYLAFAPIQIGRAQVPGLQFLFFQVIPGFLVLRVGVLQVKYQLDPEHEKIGWLHLHKHGISPGGGFVDGCC